MARVAANADVYAAGRLNIFFPANGQTPNDGDLTGQCVTLNKWFLAEMTSVPSPFSARGDARYVGDTLVAQGHAVEVPYDQRRRGDFVVYKYGQYGHIGVLLSGDRIFEQNANVGNVARRVVAGQYVYASRIGSLSESWRPVRPNIYRIKTYVEEEQEVIIGTDQGWYDRMNRLHHQLVMNADLSQAVWNAVKGQELSKVVIQWSDHPNAQNMIRAQEVGEVAVRDNWQQQIYDRTAERDAANKALAQANSDKNLLTAQVADLQKQLAENPNDQALKDQLANVQKQLDTVNAQLPVLTKENDDLKAKLAAAGSDTELLNGFGIWLTKLIARLGLKK